MNKTPVVYVVNTGGHDVEGAKVFGELRSLTEDKVNVFAVDRITTEMKAKLKDFNADRDYLLLSGAIILNLIAMKTVRGHERSVKVLIYNFHLSRYIVRNI